MPTTRLRILPMLLLHLLLFLVALVIFYLGVGIGLALNPFLGTLLWVLAGVLAVFNIRWTLRTWASTSKARPQP